MRAKQAQGKPELNVELAGGRRRLRWPGWSMQRLRVVVFVYSGCAAASAALGEGGKMAASSLEQKLSRLEAKLKQENREARRRIDLNLEISPARARPSKEGPRGAGERQGKGPLRDDNGPPGKALWDLGVGRGGRRFQERSGARGGCSEGGKTAGQREGSRGALVWDGLWERGRYQPGASVRRKDGPRGMGER